MRDAIGRLMPGQQLPAPVRSGSNGIVEARRMFMHRMPELFDVLFQLVKSKHEMTRLAACRELLDRLIGKPQISIDAVTTKVDVGALYLEALKRANTVEVTPATSHIVPSEPAQVTEGEGKPTAAATSDEGTLS